VAEVVSAAKPGDHLLCMSNGGFGGVHQKLLDSLQNQKQQTLSS
jgi:UDP-N-acetylmuramate: L-alanyl-gamma-D-glutamyl-meso-diaminopimelate ligase